MQYRVHLIFAMFMLFTASSAAEPAKTLRMGVHNFPPDFIVSADGKSCGGEGYLFIKELFVKAGFQLKAVCTLYHASPNVFAVG